MKITRKAMSLLLLVTLFGSIAWGQTGDPFQVGWKSPDVGGSDAFYAISVAEGGSNVVVVAGYDYFQNAVVITYRVGAQGLSLINSNIFFDDGFYYPQGVGFGSNGTVYFAGPSLSTTFPYPTTEWPLWTVRTNGTGVRQPLVLPTNDPDLSHIVCAGARAGEALLENPYVPQAGSFRARTNGYSYLAAPAGTLPIPLGAALAKDGAIAGRVTDGTNDLAVFWPAGSTNGFKCYTPAGWWSDASAISPNGIFVGGNILNDAGPEAIEYGVIWIPPYSNAASMLVLTQGLTSILSPEVVDDQGLVLGIDASLPGPNTPKAFQAVVSTNGVVSIATNLVAWLNSLAATSFPTTLTNCKPVSGFRSNGKDFALLQQVNFVAGDYVPTNVLVWNGGNPRLQMVMGTSTLDLFTPRCYRTNFVLQAAGTVNGAWTNSTVSRVVAGNTNFWRWTETKAGNSKFFRLRE